MQPYLFTFGHTFVTINQVWALSKYERKWFCRMSISICENWCLSFPRPTTCFRKCDILSVGQVDIATKNSSLVHPKSIKGWRKWDIGGEQALRKRATRVTPVNSNASSLLFLCVKLGLLMEDRAWELLSAWIGALCDLMGAAVVEGLVIWKEFNFRSEVERDGPLMVLEGPDSRLDISIISGCSGSTNSTLSFGFSSFLSLSSVISMVSFSFCFFTFFRSFFKASLVGCKEGHQFHVKNFKNDMKFKYHCNGHDISMLLRRDRSWLHFLFTEGSSPIIVSRDYLRSDIN